MSSPYAVPLAGLVAEAMVAGSEQIQEVPTDGSAFAPAHHRIPLGPEGGGDGD